MNTTFLSQLNWRFATKQFDPKRKVEDDKLNQILEAIRMTPTSMGLQTFHIYVISDQQTKDLIETKSHGQKQVSTSSHLIVFCYRTDIDQSLDDYAQLLTNEKLMEQSKISEVVKSRKEGFSNKTIDQIKDWSAKQLYIVLGFAMAACAELKVDSCPMEGFNPTEVDKVLGLPEGMHSVLMLPIGYRVEDPTRKKIRFNKKDLFTFVE
jgi:nitroreductase